MPGFTALKYSTPRGVSFREYEEMLATGRYGEFITRKKRNKRIRQLVSAVIFFDMDIGEECTIEHMINHAWKYNPIGQSAMALSPQQFGSLLSTMIRYDIVSKRVENNKSYYKRLV
jgi:hypothetical protein